MCRPHSCRASACSQNRKDSGSSAHVWQKEPVLSSTCPAKVPAVDAPIVIGILQRTGCILVDTHIIGHITQLVVILMPQASGRGNIGMHILRTALHGFPQCLDVVATQPPSARHPPPQKRNCSPPCNHGVPDWPIRAGNRSPCKCWPILPASWHSWTDTSG